MKTLKLTTITKGYLRVAIDNGPMNLFDQEMCDDLSQLVTSLEQNEDVKVVIFESANPDFFLAHLDVARAGQMNMEPQPATGLSQWPDIAYRLERAPFLTVGLLRGRARAVGSEFLQALDVRFASKEKAIISQIEIGCGLVPGGGGLERLPSLIGRSRTLEVVLGGDDFDADTAERYGLINRAIPDAALDAFVDNFARRVDSFDREATKLAKELINERSGLPTIENLAATQVKFFDAFGKPAAQARIGELFKRGLQQREFELDLAKNIIL